MPASTVIFGALALLCLASKILSVEARTSDAASTVAVQKLQSLS